ncbi:hypothetical protein RRF57_012790 [Xylaria bambusicola]|uniref:Uncharacterized protein n=1 Tax=Xylaria bambusicola TaxID=326684 RepID=A0AAN7UX53_9PEZI
MKLLATIAIAYFGVTWALPAQAQAQSEAKADGLGYIACSNALIFSAPYCCDNRGLLGTVSDDDAFEGQCGLFQKSAVCCVPLLNLLPPVLCIPLPRLLVSKELSGVNPNATEASE